MASARPFPRMHQRPASMPDELADKLGPWPVHSYTLIRRLWRHFPEASAWAMSLPMGPNASSDPQSGQDDTK